MSKISDGGFAFPRPVGDNMADHPADRLWNHAQTGMSLRDWFAGQALDAIIRAACAGQRFPHSYPSECAESAMARNAYRIADAMLKAREATE